MGVGVGVGVGVGAGLTVRLVDVLWITDPLLPFTVKGKVPPGVAVVVVTVIVDEFPVVLFGLNVALVFVGRPAALRNTPPANPPERVIVRVYDVLPPAETV